MGEIQLGKNGVTDNFILSLVNHFKKHNIMKIHVLKNARESGKKGKQDVKRYSNQLLKVFGPKYTAKIIGFTIVMRKWRKAQKQDL